ncbi:hypothetical protein TRVA0_010S00100 [Trichomonascus vanleenenianus]|uniref:endopolyphosphatase n=1 Tax=Trichomonascus vanleenenianus TaxID=2268995 RepID=UPI003ECA40DF
MIDSFKRRACLVVAWGLILFGLWSRSRYGTGGLLFKTLRTGTGCASCKLGLSVASKLAESDSSQLIDYFNLLCEHGPASGSIPCGYLRSALDGSDRANHSSISTDIANVLTMVKPYSLDGDYICYYLLGGLCPRPETKEFDINQWWPAKEENLNVSKFKQSDHSTYNVVHLSDVHLQLGYTEGAEANCVSTTCCSDRKVAKDPLQDSIPAPKHGMYRCDTPVALLQSVLDNIKQVELQNELDFEFALFTGDMVDHNVFTLTYNETVAEELTVMREMKHGLGDIPVYSVLGNHDSFPHAQTAQHKSGFADLFDFNPQLMASLWREYSWLDERALNGTAKHYGGYALTTDRGLRVISLNSNFWYRYNLYNYWNLEEDPDPSGVFKFLVDELVACEAKGQRAWIVTHVPTGGLANDAMPIASKIFSQIIRRFSPETVAAIFMGHTHNDEFTVIYDSTNAEKSVEDALNVAWISQSVTPWWNLNPGWRYYEVDASTFSIVNSYNYYAPLTDSVSGLPRSSLEWDLLYSAREAYDPTGEWPLDAPLNGTFWAKVASNIRRSPGFAQLFMDHSWRMSPFTPECHSEKCRNEVYCYATSMSTDEAYNCRKENQLAVSSHPEFEKMSRLTVSQSRFNLLPGGS